MEKRVGLKNVLIVLSADHGGPEAPGHLNTLGIPAHYVTPEQWDKAPAISALKQKFGLGKELIEAYRHPYLYLDREVIREKGLDPATVEKAVIEELMKFDGVALAVSSTALKEGNLPDTPLLQSVLRNFNPRRSGDIFVGFQPHCFINDFDGLTVAATHGSPWRYDSFVPVVFAGGKLTGQRVYRPIEPWTSPPLLLEPDATMLAESDANNARLRSVFPGGFSLDAAHTPHITMLQCFVRTADLDKVAAVKPYLAETGPIGAFTAPHDDAATDAGLIQYVSTFLEKMTGANFNPHVSTGVAPKAYLDKMLAEPFTTFTFSPKGAAIYQLGPFGTAAKKLKQLDLRP